MSSADGPDPAHLEDLYRVPDPLGRRDLQSEPDQVVNPPTFLGSREKSLRLHWRPVVSELSRRLKAAGCFPYTDRLDQELSSLPPRPSPKDEAAALKHIFGALVGLRNSPLRGRTRKETRELGEVCRQAIPLVRDWLQHKASEAEARARAAEAIKPLLAALPKPAAEGAAGAGAGRDGNREPSDRQRDILQVLYKRQAFDVDHRMTTDEITEAVEGKGQGNPASFKRPVADLRRRGLVDTKGSRGGGCWLTDAGQAYIKQARNL
jgi:hypothetical protein